MHLNISFFHLTLILEMGNYVIQQGEGLECFSLLVMFRQNSWTDWVMKLNYITWGAGLKTDSITSSDERQLHLSCVKC